MKKIAIAVLMLLVFAAVSSEAAENPTEREWKIYYDYVERGYYASNADPEVISRNFAMVASDNGVTEKELMAIINEVFKYGLTPEEKKIYNELEQARRDMPKGLTFNQKEEVLKEVARKLKITYGLMEDIMVRGASQGRVQ